MKIGITPPFVQGLGLESRAAPAAPAMAARRDDGSSFQAARDARRNGYLEMSVDDLLKMTSETDTARFVIETFIGEDAVRFDARPIVAPSAVVGESENGRGPAAAPAQAPDLPADLPSFDAGITGLAGELANRMEVLVDRAIPPPRVAPGMMATRYPETIQIQGGPGSLRQPVGHRQAPSVAGRSEMTSPLRYVPTAPAMRAAAKVTALPREIVISLPGLSLSPEDSMRLIEETRGQLARRGLGDRTVRIVGTGNKA